MVKGIKLMWSTYGYGLICSFQGSVLLVLLFLYIIVEQWWRTGCQLVEGLPGISKLFVVAVHYTHTNICYVLLLLSC